MSAKKWTVLSVVLGGLGLAIAIWSADNGISGTSQYVQGNGNTQIIGDRK